MARELKSWRRVRLTLVRERGESYTLAPCVRSGNDVAALVRELIGADPREVFVAVYLDGRHRVVAVHTVSTGSATGSLVHPREVFGPAVMLGAAALVVAHNHPSGDSTPSPEDRAVTERLRQAGELLGVELLDHLVLGEARFFSFASEAQHDG